MSNKFKNFFASIYLAVIGDKIGFGNGDREKNYNTSIIIDKDDTDYKSFVEGLSLIMVFRFIEQGGIIGLDMDLLIPSDDTIMHTDTIQGFINPYSNRDELYNNIVKLYLNSFKDISYMRDTLLAGRQTLESIKKINAGNNWMTFPYSKTAGGSGGPMKTMCIGLCFYQTCNLHNLIESSIMITSITHPNCTAFIGSIVSALFTSYAIRDMNPETWIFELINLLESETIDNIIEKIKPNYTENFKEDKKDFLYKLRTYVEDSFDEYNYNINTNLSRKLYPSIRMMYYFENFSSNKKRFYPGSGADDVIIIAYDCLLMSKSNYEKLIYTSMINIGDSDTIGTIASAWYGALYGFDNVPLNLINKNEADYIRTNLMSTKLHEKYYEKTIKDF